MPLSQGRMPAIGVLVTCKEGGENSHDVRLESALPRAKSMNPLLVGIEI